MSYYYSIFLTVQRYLVVFSKLIKDSIFRFKKDLILIISTGILGASLQIGAIGQVIYYARTLEKGKTFDILGYNIQPRSVDFFIFSMAVLLLFLLFSALLLYYSRNKIIKLSCSYEIFCSKKVFSMVGYMQGICSPGLPSLYNIQILLKLAGRDARICGRILRLLIKLIQPTFTFIIALGALFYINFLLTVIIFLLAVISMLFHYRNNLKGASSSKKMENYAPGAQKEKKTILQAAMSTNPSEDDFYSLIHRYYDEGEINSNLDGYRGRFQTLENARLINDLLTAILFFIVALIIGGNAIVHNAHWGSLIVYLLALRYCLNHLNTTVVTFTSINRFYPMFARYFYFIDTFGLIRGQKEILTRRYKIRVESSPFEGSMSSLILRNGDILALGSPCSFNFYDIPTYLKCLLGHKQGLMEKVLRTMNVITDTNGHLEARSFRELFCLPQSYDLETLQRDLQDHGISEEMISRLPEDLNKPISREKWDLIEPEIRYSLGLLSAIRSGQQWIVVDSKVLEHLSRRILGHLFEKLQEKITLIVFNGKLDNVGAYGETTIAIFDGRGLIGLGDVQWFESQRKNILEKMEFAKKHLTPIREKGEDEDDELDDEI